MSMIARFFDFAERRTSAGVEVRAGLTTFMVMAYIIFVNPIILGYVGVPGLSAPGNPVYWASGAHAPNEHIRLDDLRRAVAFNVHLFRALAMAAG